LKYFWGFLVFGAALGPAFAAEDTGIAQQVRSHVMARCEEMTAQEPMLAAMPEISRKICDASRLEVKDVRIEGEHAFAMLLIRFPDIAQAMAHPQIVELTFKRAQGQIDERTFIDEAVSVVESVPETSYPVPVKLTRDGEAWKISEEWTQAALLNEAPEAEAGTNPWASVFTSPEPGENAAPWAQEILEQKSEFEKEVNRQESL
jgi:hypothetical protein